MCVCKYRYSHTHTAEVLRVRSINSRATQRLRSVPGELHGERLGIWMKDAKTSILHEEPARLSRCQKSTMHESANNTVYVKPCRFLFELIVDCVKQLLHRPQKFTKFGGFWSWLLTSLWHLFDIDSEAVAGCYELIACVAALQLPGPAHCRTSGSWRVGA